MCAKNKFSFTIGLLYIKWKVMMCTFEISNYRPPKISWMGLLSKKIKLSRTWRCRISNESSSTLWYIYHTSDLKNDTSNIKIFVIGLSVWIFFKFISFLYFNPNFFISIHSLYGVAYGLLYNLLLGYVFTESFII